MSKSFLVHETMTCRVTFVRRIVVDNEADAEELAYEGCGDLLGVSIGNIVASGAEPTEIFEDAPHNIPEHFYSEEKS